MWFSLRMVDLFAGAGGLSLGLSAAGFKPIEAVEYDRDAAATYATAPECTNRARQACGRCSASTSAQRRRAPCGWLPCPNHFRLAASNLEHIHQGRISPVCESGGGHTPDCLLDQNVAGLAAPSMARYFNGLLEDSPRLKYNIAWKVVNAADYGVPQKRRRLFVVGLRHWALQVPGGDARPVSWSCLGGKRHCVEDESRHWRAQPVDRHLRQTSRPSVEPVCGHLFNGGGRAIDLASPAPTILAAAGGNKTPFLDIEEVVPEYHAHLLSGGRPRQGIVSGTRRITVEESARLQTFPPNTPFRAAGRRSTPSSETRCRRGSPRQSVPPCARRSPPDAAVTSAP